MDLVTHAQASLFSTTTVMWVIGLWIGNARPWARGRKRLMVGPSSAMASTTKSSSARQVVVVLGVGRGALEHLGDVAGGALRHEAQDGRGLLDGLPDDRAR